MVDGSGQPSFITQLLILLQKRAAEKTHLETLKSKQKIAKTWTIDIRWFIYLESVFSLVFNH